MSELEKTKGSGINHYKWNGGKFIDGNGYMRILKPSQDNKYKYELEHRYIFEQYYKCCLLPWGIVHHKNGNKLDNTIKNLEGMTNAKHAIIERFKNMSKRFCSKCKSSVTVIMKRTGRPYWYHDGDINNEDNLLCHKCYNRKIRLINKFKEECFMKKIIFKVCKKCWTVGAEVEPDGSIKCLVCGRES